jgi:hypothetical protein
MLSNAVASAERWHPAPEGANPKKLDPDRLANSDTLMKLITYLKQAASEGRLRGTGVEEHSLLVHLWKCRQGHPTGSTRLHGAAGEGEEYYCRERRFPCGNDLPSVNCS